MENVKCRIRLQVIKNDFIYYDNEVEIDTNLDETLSSDINKTMQNLKYDFTEHNVKMNYGKSKHIDWKIKEM